VTGRTAFEIEHDIDPFDDCESFVLLDGGEARLAPRLKGRYRGAHPSRVSDR
jgi:hypothetical protein